jgi:hypothetical protein
MFVSPRAGLAPIKKEALKSIFKLTAHLPKK